jgi:hypothetical protein
MFLHISFTVRGSEQKDTIIDLLHIIHGPVLLLKRRFGDWTPPPSAGIRPTQFGLIDRASPHLRTKDGRRQNPVSEGLFEIELDAG